MAKSILIYLCLALLPTTIYAQEKLLYAVKAKTNWHMQDGKTEIFAMDPSTQKPKLLFSDGNAPFSINDGEFQQFNSLITNGDKVFALAIDRPSKNFDPKKGPSVYELAIDGSNNFRKLFTTLGEQNVFGISINPEASKIGYLSYYDGTQHLFIHETSTGKLINTIELHKICPYCSYRDPVWLLDNESLIVSMQDAPGFRFTKESLEKRGTYIIKKEGTYEKLDDLLLKFPRLPRYFTSSAVPECVGVKPDGTYLFANFTSRRIRMRASLTALIYIVNAKTKSQQRVPTYKSEFYRGFKLSNSGKYLAYGEQWYESHKGNIWITDIDSGSVKKIMSYDNSYQTSLQSNITWLAGWLNQ